MNADDRDLALQHARWSLELLADTAARNRFGDIDNVDTLSIGLGALVGPLAALMGVPRDAKTALEDVVAYAEATGKVGADTTTRVVRLRELIHLATYPGVEPHQLNELNNERQTLHLILDALITKLEGASDG